MVVAKSSHRCAVATTWRQRTSSQYLRPISKRAAKMSARLDLKKVDGKYFQEDIMWFLINQYSLVFSLLLVGPVSWIVISRVLDWRWGTLFLGCFLIGALILFYTQSSEASLIDTRSEWDGALSSGTPMLGELYSDY